MSLRYFFLLGAAKSGTTWLQRMLQAHPLVGCLGEGHLLDGLVVPLADVVQRYNAKMRQVQREVYEGREAALQISEAQFAGYGRQWLLDGLQRAHKPGVVALGDKTPANSHYLPLIHQLLPEARFVHLVRDGRDVVVSRYFHGVRVHQQLANPQPLESFAAVAPRLLEHWQHSVEAASQFHQAQPGVAWLELRYEDLLDKPEACLARLIAFLVERDVMQMDPSIQSAVAQNRFEVLSQGRAAGEEDRGAFLRKGIAGDYRSHWTPEMLQAIPLETQRLLQHYGYALTHG